MTAPPLSCALNEIGLARLAETLPPAPRQQGLALVAQGCTVKCRVRLLGRACGRRMGPGSQRRGSHLSGMLLFQCVDGIGVMALGRMDSRL